MKKYNFNAGPCVLPREAVTASIEAIHDFDNTGVGILEISHRTPAWEKMMKQTADLWKELLNIPNNYQIFFLAGGASTQFFTVPANLLNKKAAYLQTGWWADKAIEEATVYGEVEIVASSKDKNYSYIPKNYVIPTDADYFHITTNNTIYGTEIHTDIDSPVPLVADMASDIMSRPVDVSKYGLIYGAAQKNVGTAGVSFVIVREDMLDKIERKLPAMMDYRTHIRAIETDNLMYNTPPVFSIYVMYETLKWVKSKGGLEVMYQFNKEKAAILYNAIDQSNMFVGTAAKEDRSLMNVCFVMADKYKDKETAFLDFANERGVVGIGGHRAAGGFRASIYNACPIEAVEVLAQCMRDFENKNG